MPVEVEVRCDDVERVRAGAEALVRSEVAETVRRIVDQKGQRVLPELDDDKIEPAILVEIACGDSALPERIGRPAAGSVEEPVEGSRAIVRERRNDVDAEVCDRDVEMRVAVEFADRDVLGT
jgi:hypothetical protein